MTVRSDGSSLAEALVAFERRMREQPADLVVLGDDSDTALAAALAALKLGIAVEALPEARGGSSENARLLAQLVQAGGEGGGAYTADA